MEEPKAGPSASQDLLARESAQASTSTALGSETKPIPNGGLRAWLQVLGTFFIFFNTWWAFPSTFSMVGQGPLPLTHLRLGES